MGAPDPLQRYATRANSAPATRTQNDMQPKWGSLLGEMRPLPDRRSGCSRAEWESLTTQFGGGKVPVSDKLYRLVLPDAMRQRAKDLS
jgi:hypothetical protein